MGCRSRAFAGVNMVSFWGGSRKPLDQRLRKPQAPAQLRFPRRHFTIVTFMIIPCEVQYSVQNQDADLIR